MSLEENLFVSIASLGSLGFSSKISSFLGSTPTAIDGKLSVNRFINNNCTGENITGKLASEEYKTASIAAVFPESKKPIAFLIFL